MMARLDDFALIIDNIANSSLEDNIKKDLLAQLQFLEINLRSDQALEDEFIKGRLTSEVYLVRKNLIIADRVRIQYNIDSNFTKNILKKLGKKDVGLLTTLRKAINDNSAWISILLTLSQIILAL